MSIHPGYKKLHLTNLIMAVLLVAAIAFLALAQRAESKSSQLTIVRDDRQLVSSGVAAREAALNDMQALGVDVVQIMVAWNQYAPSPKSSSKPSFNDKDSASYGTQKWGELDAAVRGIVARGMTPMLNPTGQAPKWASMSKKNKQFYGRFPNLKMYTNFSRAVARRYNGEFDPGDGAGSLPRVEWWGVWNEPNLGSWLQPSYRYSKTAGALVPRSPHLYRSMLNKVSKEVKSAGITNLKLFAGDTSPLGSKRKSSKSAIYPKRWWREFFCLDENSRTLKGAQRQARGCPTKFRKLNIYGIAHHPYSRGAAKSPFSAGPSVLDLSLSQTNGLVAILNRAAGAGRVSSGVPIYFTEYGLQTRPPDKHLSVSLDKQASYINSAEYLGYKNGRVHGYSQYPLVDDPLNLALPASSPKRYDGFQSGLRFNDWSLKPSYASFRLPIFVTKRLPTGVSSNKVMVWGGVRPNERPATVEIQSSSGSGFETQDTVTLGESKRYFKKTVSLSGAASKKWRLRWVDSSGVENLSRTTRVSNKG